MYDRWCASEKALAQKTPVMEAEYAIDNKSALSLFNTVLPRLKEYLTFDKRKTKQL